MAIIKGFTNIEESKKLAEILPLESADMYYFLDPTPAGNIYHLVVQRVDIDIKNLPQYDKGDVPCWSLAALLNALPKVEGFKPIIDLDINQIRYQGTFRDELVFSGKDLISPCIEMILKLKERNLI